MISSVEGKNGDDLAGITVIVPTSLREDENNQIKEPMDIETIKRLIRLPNTITLAHIHELHYTSLTPVTPSPVPSSTTSPLSSSPVSSLSLPSAGVSTQQLHDQNDVGEDDELLSIDYAHDQKEDPSSVTLSHSPLHSSTLASPMNSDNELSVSPPSDHDTELATPSFGDTITINGRPYFLSTPRGLNSNNHTHPHHRTLSYIPAFNYLNDDDDEDEEEGEEENNDNVDFMNIFQWSRPWQRRLRFPRSRPTRSTPTNLLFY